MLWNKAIGAGGTGSSGTELIYSRGITNTSSITGNVFNQGDVTISASCDLSSHSFRAALSGVYNGMSSGWTNSWSSPTFVRGMVAYNVFPSGGDFESTEFRTFQTVDTMAMATYRGMGTPPSSPTATQSGSGNTYTIPNVSVSTDGSSVVVLLHMSDYNLPSSAPGNYEVVVARRSSNIGLASLSILHQLNVDAGTVYGGTGGLLYNLGAYYAQVYVIPPPA